MCWQIVSLGLSSPCRYARCVFPQCLLHPRCWLMPCPLRNGPSSAMSQVPRLSLLSLQSSVSPQDTLTFSCMWSLSLWPPG
jgi:hypothetical protein